MISAGDAQVAYELLQGTDVDLVLLDLHLPQMSGDTFFLALTRRWPRLVDRIVLMTGDTFAEQEPLAGGACSAVLCCSSHSRWSCCGPRFWPRSKARRWAVSAPATAA